MPDVTRYRDFYTHHYEMLTAGADEATRSGLDKMAELMPFILVPVVVVCAILIALGQMDKSLFREYAWRVALMMWLVSGSAFIPYIRDMAVETVPNEYASALHAGAGQRIQAVDQFDVVDQAAGHMVSQVLGQATGIFQVGNAFAAWQARGWQKLFLDCIFAVWMAMLIVLLFAIAILSFMLIFIPFRTTMAWFMSQLSAVVSVVMWMLSASILLHIMLAGMRVKLRSLIEQGASMSIEQQIDQCFSVAGWFFICFVLLLIIPTVIGVRSGSAAAPIAAGAMVSAGRFGASLANRKR